jgi:hypothetical protein
MPLDVRREGIHSPAEEAQTAVGAKEVLVVGGANVAGNVSGPACPTRSTSGGADPARRWGASLRGSGQLPLEIMQILGSSKIADLSPIALQAETSKGGKC